jgi:hypothetical protein
MLKFIGDNWYWCGFAVMVFAMYRASPPRARGSVPLHERVFYTIFPLADPESEDRKRIHIRMGLVLLGVCILFVSLGLSKFYEWYRLQ